MNAQAEEKRLFESKVLCMQGKQVLVSRVETWPSEEYPNGNTYCFHDFYEIELFSEGQGTLFINGIPHTVGRGFFYLLRPGDCHYYQLSEEHFLRLGNLKLTGERFGSVLRERLAQFEAPFAVCVGEADLKRLEEEFALLDRCLKENAELMIQNVADRIVILLLQNLSGVRKRGEAPGGDPITRIADYINEHYAGRIRQADAAKLLSQSESYFGVYFKKRTGLCFSEYLKRVRLYHAQRLLKTSALSVKEIAFATGFRSQEYFARVFRGAFGVSPLEYRKEIRAEETDEWRILG